MKKLSGLRLKIHRVIYEADTSAGKAFDIVLLSAILLSIIAVMLESVHSIGKAYSGPFKIFEWIITILFTCEYILRLLSVEKPLKYVFSFYGLVDILSILPTYMSLFVGDIHYLMTIRAVRLFRIFRIFKLARFLGEADHLWLALKASRPKITVFLITVITMAILLGSVMYLIEGEENGFTSIPRSIYWAIVTMTTVGYGDITPQTITGQMLATIIMVMGYGIIAIPTGIVSAELAFSNKKKITTQACPSCSLEGHESDAKHCKFCGVELNPDEQIALDINNE